MIKKTLFFHVSRALYRLNSNRFHKLCLRTTNAKNDQLFQKHGILKFVQQN